MLAEVNSGQALGQVGVLRVDIKIRQPVDVFFPLIVSFFFLFLFSGLLGAPADSPICSALLRAA